MGTIILISVIVISIFATLVALFSRFKRCPSDKLLVVYGKGTGGSDQKASAKVVHGGAAFIIPVFQAYEFLDLKPIPIEVALKNALSKQNIRINVPSTFTVAISSEPGLRENAAERLLGLDKQTIAKLAEDIIFGQMRLVIATMDIEEINNNRDKFLENVQKNLEGELQKIGLKLINVNVQDITDESGYITALGKEAASHAINEAKKIVAEKDRDGSIGQANAKQDERIQVANATTKAEVGEAEANKDLRIKKAVADATAIEGENLSAIKIASSVAEMKKAKAEAEKIAVTAEKVNAALALKDSYTAQKDAENERAERDKATEYANVVIPAQIHKQKVEIEAEAEAERIRRIAKGNADGVFYDMEARAKGIKEILTKQAEGIKTYVEAAGGDPKAAAMLMITEKLPELYKIQTEAIQNIEFGKITVWDSGNGGGEGSSTSAWLQNALKVIPGFKEVYASIGMELPKLLQGAVEEVKKEQNKIEATAEKKEEKK